MSSESELRQRGPNPQENPDTAKVNTPMRLLIEQNRFITQLLDRVATKTEILKKAGKFDEKSSLINDLINLDLTTIDVITYVINAE